MNQKKEIKTKKSNLYFFIILVFYAFLLYGNTIRNGYSLDDSYVTHKNPKIEKGIKAIPDILSSRYVKIFADDGQGELSFGYRPIAQITFAIERELFGDNPNLQHFFNVLLYALTLILLFLVLQRLLPKNNSWFSFLVVLIWAAHPLHTEVVASLKNREEILSFLFALLSILYFIKYTKLDKNRYLVFGSLMFLLSVFSKFSVPSFLLLIPLALYFFLDLKGNRLIHVIFCILIPIIIYAYFELYAFGGTVRLYLFYENPLFIDTDFLTKLATGMVGLLYYIKLLIFPHPLIFYYGYDMVPVVGLGNYLAIISILIHLALAVVAVILFKKRHILSYFIIFYISVLSTYANFATVVPGIIAERYTYIASLSFAVAVVYFIFSILKQKPYQILNNRYKTITMLIVLAILIPYTIKTIDRNKDWESEATLYENDIKHAEKSAKANYLYAAHLRTEYIKNASKNNQQYNSVQQDKIIKYLKNAINIYPEYIDAINSLGEVYIMALNDNTNAIKQFERTVEIKPDFASGWYNLGYTYFTMQDFEKALPNFKQSAFLKPGDYGTLSNLANTYYKLNHVDSAINVMSKAIETNPEIPHAYIQMANYQLITKDTLNAISNFEKAYNLDKGNQKIKNTLYNYYTLKGDNNKAQNFK